MWDGILFWYFKCRSITRPLRSSAIKTPLKFKIKCVSSPQQQITSTLNAATPITKHSLSTQSSWDIPQPGTDDMYANMYNNSSILLSRSSRKKNTRAYIYYVSSPQYTSCSHTIMEPKRLKDMTIDCRIIKKKKKKTGARTWPSTAESWKRLSLPHDTYIPWVSWLPKRG